MRHPLIFFAKSAKEEGERGFRKKHKKSQMINFSTWIPGSDSHSSALLDFILSFDNSVCTTMAFPPLRNSDHVVLSVSIYFPINTKQDPPFHRVAYDYSRADWDGFHDHFRDVPWEDIFKLSLLLLLVNFVRGIRLELMYIFLIVSIRSNFTHLHGFQHLVLLQ